MTQSTLILVGDSWTVGEWRHSKDGHLELNHPGMTEYLKDYFKVVNLSRGGISNWQICYTVWNYLSKYARMVRGDFNIVVFQTDAYRSSSSQQYDVDYDSVYRTAENLEHFYTHLIEIFYIKLNQIAQQYDIKINVAGALTDIDMSLITNFENLIPICPSWIQLLNNKHTPSIIPLQFNSEFFVESKKLDRLDLCEQISDRSNQQFLQLQDMLESDLFGPALGDYHPSRKGHEIVANHIIKNLHL